MANVPKNKTDGEEEEEEDTGDVEEEEEEEETEDSEDESEEDETKKGCKMSKTANTPITGDDLQKSLDHLEEISHADVEVSRKDDLLSKASAEELTAGERGELFDLLGGTPAAVTAQDTPADTIVKGLSENSELSDALDVSDYLREQHTEMVKSLSAVGDEITKSDNRRMEFDLVMAKALHDVGSMVKSLSESFEDALNKPARAPKSRGVQGGADPLKKSFANQEANEGGMDRASVLAAMDGLMEKSMESGTTGHLNSGEDIVLAISKYEQTSMISPTMVEAIRNHRAGNVAH